MNRRRLIAFAVIVAVVPVAGFAGTYAIDWSTIDGGGGRLASSDNKYVVHGTIGQPDAGAMLEGGSYTVEGGFWQKVAEVVQTDGAPILFIRQTGPESVRLYWKPTTEGTLLLQSSPSLAPGSWEAVPTEVAFDEKGNRIADFQALENVRCFRLQLILKPDEIDEL